MLKIIKSIIFWNEFWNEILWFFLWIKKIYENFFLVVLGKKIWNDLNIEEKILELMNLLVILWMWFLGWLKKVFYLCLL